MNLELRDYLAIALRWWWLFALATGVAAAGSWFATRFVPETYASQTTLMVGRAINNPEPNFQSIYMSQNLAQTYAQMATRQPVLERVVEALELQGSWQALRGIVKANPVPGSQLFEVRVIDVDPVRAQAIADEVANQLIVQSPSGGSATQQDREFVAEQTATLMTSITEAQLQLDEINAKIGVEVSARSLADLQNDRATLQAKIETWRSQYASLKSSVEGSDVNSLLVIEKAGLGSRVGPNVRSNIGMAAALGFGLALLAVMVIQYVDDTVRTGDDTERRLGIATLATIEMMPEAETRRTSLITLLQPRSPVAEAYRVLRTNLMFSLIDKGPARLVVTSSNPGEGKSTTASNLAVVVAQAGDRVLLVDTDLRRPSLHRFFDVANGVGLTTLLLDDEPSVIDVSHQVDGVPGLRVLTSGPVPPNPAEALTSARMRSLLDRLIADVDLIILDSPPLLVVTDGAILAANATGTLMVYDCGRTRVDAAKRASAVLEHVGVRPIGAVVNRFARSRVGSYYFHYYYSRYGYGDYYGDGKSSRKSSNGTEGMFKEESAVTATGGTRRRLAHGWNSLSRRFGVTTYGDR